MGILSLLQNQGQRQSTPKQKSRKNTVVELQIKLYIKRHRCRCRQVKD